jgi:ferredoxin
MIVSKKIVLHFPPRLVDRAIVYHLIKDYDLELNIMKASIIPDAQGLMVLELRGQQTDYDRGIKYLTETGVHIQSLSQNVVRNDDRCTHCGACVTVCPTKAFQLDLKTRLISFDAGKCIACGLCLKACPLRAMELHF